MIRQPPSSPLFPYPTLFRSVVQVELDRAPVAVPRALQRPGRAVDVATARRQAVAGMLLDPLPDRPALEDRKSTRLNSSHANISYAVFCLKKKIKNITVIYID